MKSFNQHLKEKCQDPEFENLFNCSQDRLGILLDLCDIINDECLSIESVSQISGVKLEYLEKLLDKDELVPEDNDRIEQIIKQIQNAI